MTIFNENCHSGKFYGIWPVMVATYHLTLKSTKIDRDPISPKSQEKSKKSKKIKKISKKLKKSRFPCGRSGVRIPPEPIFIGFRKHVFDIAQISHFSEIFFFVIAQISHFFRHRSDFTFQVIIISRDHNGPNSIKLV